MSEPDTDPAPPLPDFDLAGFLPYRLAVAAQRTSEELARQYRARFGISIAEWRVLVHLTQADAVSVRDIERRVAMEKSKVSRAATRLCSAGFVAKRAHEGDRRLVRLSLTRKGRALMADLLPVARAYQADMEARLGAAHRSLDEGLSALLAETPVDAGPLASDPVDQGAVEARASDETAASSAVVQRDQSKG